MLKKLIESILRFLGLIKDKVSIGKLDSDAKKIEEKIENLEKKKDNIDEDKTIDDNIDYFNRKL